MSDSGSDSELETFTDSEEDSKPSPVKTRRMSGSENLRNTKGSSGRNSPLPTERPCSSKSEKRDSPLRKVRSEKSGSPAPNTEKPGSPARRRSARNSPLKTDGSDSESSNLTPKKVCSPKRAGSPLIKSSPLRKGSPSVKSSPQRNSPQRRKVEKSESIHNDVHPAVIDNIRRSLDEDKTESSEVNESVSSASEVSDVSKHDDSLDVVTDTRDYTKFLGKPDGEFSKMEKI